MSGQKIIVGLGELLWDMLPSGDRLGGAPANFAMMSARLGNCGVIASRLGMDALGAKTRSALNNLPADISFVQSDSEHSTGTVGVKIVDNEPHYVIHEPAAWDFLEWTPEWRNLAQSSSAVCFGTLAQRNPVSRRTIREFLHWTSPGCIRVFDVNLRAPFFSVETISESLAVVTIFKLNELEVPIVLPMLGGTPFSRGEAGLLSAARWLIDKYSLRLVAITLGGDGSMLVTANEVHRHPGVAAQVVDTVGAGDAFTAALVHSYLEGASLAKMNEACNRWGAWVASQPGAMPALDAETLAEITQQIETFQGL